MGKRILAMYDIRGKQNFIFRKGKLREVIGASWVIRDLFKDYLCNEKIYKYNPKDENDKFSWEGFHQHIDSGFDGEIIYDGGGNFFVLYKDEESCQATNRRFTKKLLEKTGTLKVLCSYVEISEEENNYREDEKRLRQQNRLDEAGESVIYAANILPFTKVDRNTSLPYTDYFQYRKENEQVTRESLCKLKKYEECRKLELEKEQLILDEMVQDKGKNSLLAIIHIDGNNMGAKVQTALENCTTYEDCILRLREFSRDIQKNFIDDRRKDIFQKLENNRFVVSAGDDFTIICKAQDALTAVLTYLNGLKQTGEYENQNSSCAGIAIFHSHAPFDEAYRIAEECCDNAKKVMKDNQLTDACFIDFEYLQSGVGMSLEGIRQEVGEVTSKPWLYSISTVEQEKINGKKYVSIGSNIPGVLQVDNVIKKLQKLGRTNVKGLAEAALAGKTPFRFELERIVAHVGKEQKENSILVDYLRACESEVSENEKRFRGMVYDCVIFYDLWFHSYEVEGDKVNE